LSDGFKNITEHIPGVIFAMVIAFFGFGVWTQFKPISALM